MKRKLLTTMLALMMTASVATVMFGCDDGSHTHTYATEWTTDDTHHWKSATCEHTAEVNEKGEHSWGEDGKCTVCQKEEIVVNTVTQTGWTNAFDLLNVDGEWSGRYTSSQNNVEGVVQTVSTHNGISYTTFERNGVIYESYAEFDDDARIATVYSGQRTATTNVESWNKQTLPTNLYDEYRARFSLFGRFDLVKGYRIEEDEGEDCQLAELYQAFTYSEEDGVYSATLWANTSTEDFIDYSSMYIEMTFEAGKIIQIMYYYHLDNENIIINIDIGYSAEVSIPQEALNAGSGN